MSNLTRTQSALDAMVAGTMARKDAKATGLTPVGFERTLPSSIDAAFPMDVPEQNVRHFVVLLRHTAQVVTEQANALEAALGVPSTAPVPRAAEQAPFAEQFAAKVAAAQADVFVSAREADMVSDAWTCPKHPGGPTHTTTSRRGRSYIMCDVPGCGDFEREEA